jgi:hypothetical protein
VLTINEAEHERRRAAGVGGIPSLAVLDALMCLPAGVDVSTADLGDRCLARLREARPGCVEWLQGGRVVHRLAVPPVDVALVVVDATDWRTGLRRAAAFAPFAMRVVRLDRLPARWPEPAWEAVSAGAGIWAPADDGGVVEYVPPAEFVPRWVKPARWRFQERAYSRWLTTTGP